MKSFSRMLVKDGCMYRVTPVLDVPRTVEGDSALMSEARPCSTK